MRATVGFAQIARKSRAMSGFRRATSGLWVQPAGFAQNEGALRVMSEFWRAICGFRRKTSGFAEQQAGSVRNEQVLSNKRFWRTTSKFASLRATGGFYIKRAGFARNKRTSRATSGSWCATSGLRAQQADFGVQRVDFARNKRILGRNERTSRVSSRLSAQRVGFECGINDI